MLTVCCSSRTTRQPTYTPETKTLQPVGPSEATSTGADRPGSRSSESSTHPLRRVGCCPSLSIVTEVVCIVTYRNSAAPAAHTRSTQASADLRSRRVLTHRGYVPFSLAALPSGDGRLRGA